MNNINKQLFFFTSLIFIGCSSLKKNKDNFKEDKITISSGNGEAFSYKSDDPNLICIAFLNNFNDSIVVFNNNKEVLRFRRDDTLSYKEMEHKEIFKTIKLDADDDINKIQIYLLNEKSKISFNLEKYKSLYLVSRYDKSWYVTVWENN